MTEKADISTLESAYPFMSRNSISIPHERSVLSRVISDYHSQYPNLDFRYSAFAVAYIYALNMTPEDYRNKKILDAGSGLGRFKGALQAMGIDADVTNFDDGEMYSTSGDYQVDVQGKVENMPFPDNTFDVAVLNWVFPNGFLDDSTDTSFMARQLRELVRVTKKGGGVIRYTPFRAYHKLFGEKQQAIYDEATRRAFNELDKLHKENPTLKVRLTRIDDDAVDGQPEFDDILEISL